MLETVTTADVARWLAALERVGLIQCYLVDGKPYLRFLSWDRHQETRAKKSKWPEPMGDVGTWAQMRADARTCSRANAATDIRDVSTCEQMRADVPVTEKREARSGDEKREAESVSALAPAAPSPRPTRRRLRAVPSGDEELTLARREVARREQVPGAIEVEWAKMLDHFRGHGKPIADLDATWRNWCRRAVEIMRRDLVGRRPHVNPKTAGNPAAVAAFVLRTTT
jgi:hypothetical protein